MTLIEEVAATVSRAIARGDAFNSAGQIVDESALARALEFPHVCALLIDARQWSYTYLNSCFGKLTDLPSGWCSVENDMEVLRQFDAESVPKLMETFTHFRDGDATPLVGMTGIAREDLVSTIVCEDCNFPAAKDAAGKVHYYVHLFFPSTERYRVNAYHKFPVAELTNRQKEVFNELITGKSISAISVDLGIAPKTLEKHNKAIFDLTGCRNQAELIQCCRQ